MNRLFSPVPFILVCSILILRAVSPARAQTFISGTWFAHGGSEPGSKKNVIILNFHWIPDLAPQDGARPE
jgi:hypothetical protein